MQYGLSEKQLSNIVSALKKYDEIDEVVLFGSRALGTYKEASDIDIALKGDRVTSVLAAKLKTFFEEESYSPYFFDFIAYPEIKNDELKIHIDEKGKVIARFPKKENREVRTFIVEDLIRDGILTINDGYRAKNSELSATGLPFARAGNVNTGFHFDHADFFPETSLDRVGNKISKPGDVVFTSKGTVGRFAYVKDDTPRFIYSPQLCFWRSEKWNIINPQFLYFWMNSPAFISQMYEVKGQTDMADYVNLRDQRSFLVHLPPLPEQKAIASVLSSLDDKIDLLHRQNKTLESMAETLFRQWFVEEADDEKCTLDEIIDFNPKTVLSNGTMAPYLEMSNVSTSTFHPEDWFMREFTSGTKFINSDTLLARITPCLENGKTCYVTFLPENSVGWGSTEYIVLRVNEQIHPLFAYCLVTNNDFHDYAEICMEGSSGRQRVNLDHLKEYEINKPNQDSISSFNDIASSIEPRLIHNHNQITTLKALRDTLLPKLMSGEVRVKYDE